MANRQQRSERAAQLEATSNFILALSLCLGTGGSAIYLQVLYHPYMLTVLYLAILKPKLFLLLPHRSFKESFSVVVLTRYKEMLLATDLTAFTVRQHSLMLSATIRGTLILSQCIFSVTLNK
jgi:hypothetical protein